MTRFLIPKLRRIVQAAGLLLLLVLPLFPLYTHYKSARAIDDLPAGQWRTTAIRAVDDVVGENEAWRERVEQTQGTFWSMRLAGVTLSDPLAGAEAILSSKTFYQPMLWSLLVPIIASVLLGRAFCGWICPMNTLLEFVDNCRRLLRVVEIRERDVKFSLWNKYVILVAALGFAGVTAVPFLALVYPPAVLSREMHLFVFGAGVGIGVYLMLAICVFELFVSKRWWCRYVCPGGALYSLLGRFRVLRIRRNRQNCTECGDCVRVCQFGLKPMLVQMTGMECTNCATCIAACDSDALRFSIVLPVVSSEKNEPPSTRTSHNVALPAEPLVAIKSVLMAIIASALLSQPAHAHHILGLPHYSYKENYPQAPTLEYPATTGPYDVLMTTYPGNPVPTQAAMIAFYIKDRDTGQPYGRPVSLRVLQTSTFGANKTIYDPQTHEPFDNQHKYTVTFPADGEYIIELTMDVEGQTEVIPFLVVAGNPTATTSVLAAIGFALAVFLVTVRAIKKKRDRRKTAPIAV